MTEKDTFKTILKPSHEILFKDKNSKFFGYTFPVRTEDDVKAALSTLEKDHHKARHLCYAYQLGEDTFIYRVNDDGEPGNSAGMPIYGQIQSFEVTNILVAVVRYFGGVKLGITGLINAYKTAAQMALEVSKIVEKTIDINYTVYFDYESINTVMRIIKEHNLNIVDQKLELDCEITLAIRKSEAEQIFEIFSKVFKVNIKKR